MFLSITAAQSRFATDESFTFGDHKGYLKNFAWGRWAESQYLFPYSYCAILHKKLQTTNIGTENVFYQSETKNASIHIHTYSCYEQIS